MLCEIHDREYFIAFGVAAFDVEIEVHFLKCLAEDGCDVFGECPTAIGTSTIFFFGCPADDTTFAEEFAAGVTFVWVKYNLYANGAVKGLMSIAYKAIWVIS